MSLVIFILPLARLPNNTILFIEDERKVLPEYFDRDLQSLIQLPNFKGVRAIVIGRFQRASKMTNEKLIQIITSKRELKDIPVIANIDCSHTDPKITFPIGGSMILQAFTKDAKNVTIKIVDH